MGGTSSTFAKCRLFCCKLKGPPIGHHHQRLPFLGNNPRATNLVDIQALIGLHSSSSFGLKHQKYSCPILIEPTDLRTRATQACQAKNQQGDSWHPFENQQYGRSLEFQPFSEPPPFNSGERNGGTSLPGISQVLRPKWETRNQFKR